MPRMPDLSLLPESATVVGEDLRIGGCLLSEVAEQFGTPAYVFDEQALRDRAAEYQNAMTSRHRDSRVCFAVKAYPSVSMIRILAAHGLGCDVVGAGELRLALAAGADPAAIVMHGNAKSDEDIAAALDAGIGFIVVDGFDDIDRIERLAPPRTPGLPRVSPRLSSPTPPAPARRGLHVHIGSQTAALGQFEAAVAALASLDRFGVYDFGGGLAVRYEPGDTVPTADEYVARLVGAAHRQLGTDIEIIIEPGRSMVARAGITLYRGVTVKQAGKLHGAGGGGTGDKLQPPPSG